MTTRLSWRASHCQFMTMTRSYWQAITNLSILLTFCLAPTFARVVILSLIALSRSKNNDKWSTTYVYIIYQTCESITTKLLSTFLKLFRNTPTFDDTNRMASIKKFGVKYLPYFSLVLISFSHMISLVFLDRQGKSFPLIYIAWNYDTCFAASKPGSHSVREIALN